MSNVEDVAEEVVIDIESVEVETVEEIGESEYSAAEEKAMSSGWRPEEEWSGDSDDWIDAKTFNRNGEFMSRIQHQTKELSSNRAELDALKAGMKELGDHNKKIAEQEFKNAIKSLKNEKVMALEEDDHVSVMEIDDKIDELKETKRETEVAASQEMHEGAQEVAPNPAFVEWSSVNQWYQSDVGMRGAADAIGMDYADKHQGAPIEDVLQYVSNQMKRDFPNKFGNTNKGAPSTVTESQGATKRTKGKKFTAKDLNDDQMQFAKMFVDTGAFENVQEYVDSLAKSGEL